MGKYFTVTVLPTITASRQTGAFADDDVLFDWTAFNIPKGASRLIGITALVRGVDQARQEQPFDLYFAKTLLNGNSTPGSLGTINASANGSGFYNHLLGCVNVAAADYRDGIDVMGMANVQTLVPNFVLEGEPSTGRDVGYDKIYVGGIAQGALDFSTGVHTTGAVDVSALSTATVSSLDDGSGGSANATRSFAVGDIIHAQDDVIIGEIQSIDSATAITFRHDNFDKFHANGIRLYDVPNGLTAWKLQNSTADATAGDLANNDELHNIHPITLTFHFER